jgi:hypothetical protein
MATTSYGDDLLQAYQKASQELSQQAQQMLSNSDGSAYASIFPVDGESISGWSVLGSTTTATASWPQTIANPTLQGRHQTFNRINDVVSHFEGSAYEQPLDELRIKVAKWLRR